jgi:hypothetical protein
LSTPSNPPRKGLDKRILWKNICILINKQNQVDDCQYSKSTANPNRGPRRTSTVWSHLLDRNHISVRTMPASLSLGIIFISLISYFWSGSRSALYVNRRIYSKNKARTCCFFWWCYLGSYKSVWSHYQLKYLIYI